MIGHLQVYTSYSFQQSTILIKELCQQAKHLGYQALAINDVNSMYGVAEFYGVCKSYGLKPVIGMEATVLIEGDKYSLLLYAKDTPGYFDLIKISTKIQLSADHAIDLEGLYVYSEHLYVVSGCQEGIIERSLDKEMDVLADNYVSLLKNKFHDNFFLCIQNHGLLIQQKRNQKLIELASKYQVKVCCSNEVRYLQEKDALALDLLHASSLNYTLDKMHEPITTQLYLKDANSMCSLFNQEYIDNTNFILSSCNVTIPMGEMHLPKYDLPETVDTNAYLKQLCNVGLNKRLNGNVNQTYQARLEKELGVIQKMGFCDYFLIVFDYVRFAKKEGILVGPGRGSAAGSLVAYVLGITNVDPIEHDLLFERFLNEERISMPDIDVDFQDNRREEVVAYITQKYGKDNVAQIVTFSTYGPKVALRDLAKVMNIPTARVDILSKMIPTDLKSKKSIAQLMEESYEFSSFVNKDDLLSKIIQSAIIVEKLPRNISTHAAGIVLSKDVLMHVVPLAKTNTGVISQYSKKYIESIGLLKMDVLGLRNLTLLQYMIEDIERVYHKKININNLDTNDQKTFELFRRGDTFGIFQLESTGIRNLIRSMQCDCFNDIVATIALYRPGPMENNPIYIARKTKKEAIIYPLEQLKPILEPTYGIFIYQEQIMQVATLIAGFSLSKADILRKAMSDKNLETMKSLKQEFLDGGVQNGYNKEEVSHIYDLIEKFADYGFNKSHSVVYAQIAYQQAYIKANFPLVFFSSNLSNDQSSATSKLRIIQEMKKNNMMLLPPSINKSTNRFTIEGDNIRYSLLAVKNIGQAGYQAIIDARQAGPFKDFFDFLSRVQNSRLNQAMIESLIDAGAFDEFGYNRPTIKANISKFMEFSTMANSFGIEVPPQIQLIKEKKLQTLELEKNALGIYLTSHPIVLAKSSLDTDFINIMDLEKYRGKYVAVMIQIQKVRKIFDKKNNQMCFIEGNDETGSIEGVVFSQVFDRCRDQLKIGNIVYIEAKVDNKDKLSLLINQVKERGIS